MDTYRIAATVFSLVALRAARRTGLDELAIHIERNQSGMVGGGGLVGRTQALEAGEQFGRV